MFSSYAIILIVNKSGSLEQLEDYWFHSDHFIESNGSSAASTKEVYLCVEEK